jgi:hypothetical protein
MKLGELQSWSGTLWKNKLLFVELKFSALATNLTIVPLCSHYTMNTLSSHYLILAVSNLIKNYKATSTYSQPVRKPGFVNTPTHYVTNTAC